MFRFHIQFSQEFPDDVLFVEIRIDGFPFLHRYPAKLKTAELQGRVNDALEVPSHHQGTKLRPPTGMDSLVFCKRIVLFLEILFIFQFFTLIPRTVFIAEIDPFSEDGVVRAPEFE